MAAIKSKNTGPEVRVRKMLHAMGYRFRLHARELPGKPDIVFRTRRKAIFVHGCFWHGHEAGCSDSRSPKSNENYWNPKIAGNRERDLRHLAALREMGWKVLVLWDCEVASVDALSERLNRFLK